SSTGWPSSPVPHFNCVTTTQFFHQTEVHPLNPPIPSIDGHSSWFTITNNPAYGMTGTITGLTPGTRYRVQAKLNTTLSATHVQPANQYCSQVVLNVAGQETSSALSSGQWRTATVSLIASVATASINIGALSPSAGSLCFLVVSIDANSR